MDAKSVFDEQHWQVLVEQLSKDFPYSKRMDINTILYLIGIQELGKPHQVFFKDEKINLIHIATCRVLLPFGYYFFEYKDNEGWPHYRRVKDHLSLSEKEQTVLLKEAILTYFKSIDYLQL